MEVRLSIVLFTLIPVLATAVGALIAVWRRPGPALVSAIQHFAAGVVFAAAAAEILPDVIHGGSVVATLVGGGCGVVVMLLIRQIETAVAGPIGLLTTVGVDMLIDGLVLGLAFVGGGEQAGLLLTVALTLEVLFLGLTVTNALSERTSSKVKQFALTVGLALLLPVGALIATPAATLPPRIMTGLLSFGLIALLYLVTEELLVEAHEQPDTPWITSAFFVGFLALIGLEELIGL